jgi:hypothetical protein
MKFNAVRRNASLSVKKIEKPYASDLHGDACILEKGCSRKARVKFGSCIRNLRGKRAAAPNTAGTDEFGDNGIPSVVTQNYMIIGVSFLLIRDECCIHYPLRRFVWLHPAVVRRSSGSRPRPHRRYCS